MALEFSHLRRPDDDVRTVANGAGGHRAAAGIEEALAGFRPDIMISMGFCGALDPTLEIAEIVVGSTVFADGAGFPAEPPITSAPHRTGPICTANHIIGTAQEKKQLYSTGVIAVEMEAAAVAQKAQKLGLPFFCIKSVTDLAEETLANDFNAVLRPDGRFDTIKLLASSLRHPRSRLPELFRLQRRCALAARALGEFIADCRF